MKKPSQYHYTVEGSMVIQADIKIINEFSKEEDDICERALKKKQQKKKTRCGSE